MHEIFYTARQFSAEEALGMGLINRLVPGDELESYVKSYCDECAADDPCREADPRRGTEARTEARHGAVQAGRRRVLRQRGLHRGPHRLRGKAPPGVQGPLALNHELHSHSRYEYARLPSGAAQAGDKRASVRVFLDHIAA
jgi:enoyl-CoA hydratase/carnithine racemase